MIPYTRQPQLLDTTDGAALVGSINHATNSQHLLLGKLFIHHDALSLVFKCYLATKYSTLLEMEQSMDYHAGYLSKVGSCRLT